MTAVSRDWPLPDVVPLHVLGPMGVPLSTDDGQSKQVSPLERHEGWLAKLYRSPAGAAESARLDALIALPGAAGERDRELLRSSTSWPVARITGGGGETVGCVIPVAPEHFRVTLQASASQTLEKYLDVDLLALPSATLVGRSLRAPTDAERLKVCRGVVAVAACLERHGIVYSDWSYSNTFWDPVGHSVFVIDIDGCGRGSTPNVFQPHWEDPLTGRTGRADGCTDRFRVALLVARGLTSTRDFLSVLHAVDGTDGSSVPEPVAEVLLDMLLAVERRHRPTLDMLLAVMDGKPYLRMKTERTPVPPLGPATTARAPAPGTAPAAAPGPRQATAPGGGRTPPSGPRRPPPGPRRQTSKAHQEASSGTAHGPGTPGGPPVPPAVPGEWGRFVRYVLIAVAVAVLIVVLAAQR